MSTKRSFLEKIGLIEVKGGEIPVDPSPASQGTGLGPNMVLQPQQASSDLVMPAAVATGNEFFGPIRDTLTRAMASMPSFLEFFNQLMAINNDPGNTDLTTARRLRLAYKAAETSLATRGQKISPADISRGVDALQQVLEKDKQNFGLQNEAGYQQNVAGVRAKIQAAEERIKQAQKDLTLLEEQVKAFLAQKEREKATLTTTKEGALTEKAQVEGQLADLEDKKLSRLQAYEAAFAAHSQELSALADKIKDLK